MARRKYDGLVSTVGTGGITNAATALPLAGALTYSNGAAVPILTGSGDTITLSILDSAGRVSEIVDVTAYDPAAPTTCTVVRGRYGTTGVAHAAGDRIVQAAYAADLIGLPASVWAATTSYQAYQLVQLPTGGLGYSVTARTSGATFNAAERAAWTFLPGNHTETVTAAGTGTWLCPAGITQVELELVGAGAGGAGGGSASSTGTQVGGGGGSCGERCSYRGVVVTPGTGYNYTIGAAGVGTAGGAAGGNAGGTPDAVTTQGGTSSINVGAVTYRAYGGGAGNVSPANNAGASVGTGAAGAVTWGFSASGIPGAGGTSSNGFGAPAVPLAGLTGGSGGSASLSGAGGSGGAARTTIATQITRTSPGGAPDANGTAGVTATQPGCGGGGGGGGAVGGAGGAGGNGAPGQLTVRF